MEHPRDSSPPELSCPECAYNLAGLTSDRCPWCGWTVDVQELVAENLSRKTGSRLSVAGTALAVGLCSTIGLVALFSRGRNLGWRDGLAVVSVSTVAMGHFGLAWVALRTRTHWPMHKGEVSNVLRIIGWASIAAAVVAATPLLSAAPSPLIVKGVQVNGILEFVVTSFFFSLPGVMLLILRLVSYRHGGRTASLARGAAGTAGTAPFLVEVDRRYAPDRIAPSWVESPRATTPAIEEIIARTWEVETSIARQEGRTLFNGEVARLVRVEASDSGLKIQLGATCYCDFLATNLLHARTVTQMNPDARADALGISGLVTTSDAFLVLGMRSRRVYFHTECVHTFGGLVEAADRTDSGYDVVGSLLRELTEELGISRSEMVRIAATGLVRDGAIMQPELLFDVLIAQTRVELAGRFDLQTDPEHTEWVFVPDDPEATVDFLQTRSQVTPVAQAALLLHGKHAWGMNWYEKSCMRLYGRLPDRHVRQ